MHTHSSPRETLQVTQCHWGRPRLMTRRQIKVRIPDPGKLSPSPPTPAEKRGSTGDPSSGRSLCPSQVPEVSEACLSLALCSP